MSGSFTLLSERVSGLAQHIAFLEESGFTAPNLIEGKFATKRVQNGLAEVEALLLRYADEIVEFSQCVALSTGTRMTFDEAIGQNTADALCRVASWRYGEMISDYEVDGGSLELRAIVPCVTMRSKPTIWLTVNGLQRGHELLRENQNSGYCFHYMDAQRARSDLLFTVIADERTGHQPAATWEKRAAHSTALQVDVRQWDRVKRANVSEVCLNDMKQGRMVADYIRPGSRHELLVMNEDMHTM